MRSQVAQMRHFSQNFADPAIVACGDFVTYLFQMETNTSLQPDVDVTACLLQESSQSNEVQMETEEEEDLFFNETDLEC